MTRPDELAAPAPVKGALRRQGAAAYLDVSPDTFDLLHIAPDVVLPRPVRDLKLWRIATLDAWLVAQRPTTGHERLPQGRAPLPLPHATRRRSAGR